LLLYLSSKIQVFYRKGHVAKLCIVTLPLFVASLVRISRVDNYRHHWEHVFVGRMIDLYFLSFLFSIGGHVWAFSKNLKLMHFRIKVVQFPILCTTDHSLDIVEILILGCHHEYQGWPSMRKMQQRLGKCFPREK
jgi:hypothetical protein